MFCNNCGAQYDVVPIDNGKSKFCRNCGNLLYKNENGSNVFNIASVIPQNDEVKKQQEFEAERLKQEEILRQRQFEIQKKQKEAELEQQRQFEIERQKNIEYEKQRLLELEKQKEAEQERKRQEEIIKQRQLELEKQKQAELEKQKQDEILKQQVAILEEKVRLQKEIEATQLIKQQEQQLIIQQQKEAELIKQEEIKRLEDIEKEKDLQQQIETEILKDKKSEIVNNNEIAGANIDSVEKKSNKFWYFMVPFLLLVIVSAIGYFIFPDKIKAIFYPSPVATDSAVVTNTTVTPTTNDTILIEQIKTDLTGKQVLSWNAIKATEIKELNIISVSEIDKNSAYIVEVSLDDHAGTKATAELQLAYDKIILANVITNKITYKNTAPVNAWFSFEPIENCSIIVNTNNNPIQLKTCENCQLQKINTNVETAQKLETQPPTIFISSDTKYEAEVDFTYIPIK